MKSWAYPAAIIVGIEYAVALAIGARVGFHYSIPFAGYLVLGLTIGVAGTAIAVLARTIRYIIRKEPHPIRRLIAEPPAVGGFVVGVVLVTLQMSVLTWTKIMLPIASPFWADPGLARLDHAIFLGAEPWKVTFALFGWSARLIDPVYGSWALVKFATLIVVLSQAESPRKQRAMLAYFLVMAAGALGQYLGSSAGPIFYERFGFGDRFAALPLEPWVSATREYLWQDYLRAGGHIGGGISAMPSLHVAIALWVALCMRSYVPRLAWLGFTYFALILLGSVLLGWHYAVDGIVAIGITVLAWKVAGAGGRVARPTSVQLMWAAQNRS